MFSDQQGFNTAADSEKVSCVCFFMAYGEGVTRIELASSIWKTEALPLSYTPVHDSQNHAVAPCVLPYDDQSSNGTYSAPFTGRCNLFVNVFELRHSATCILS